MKLFSQFKSGRNQLGGVTIDNPLIYRAMLFSLWDSIFFILMMALTETFSVAAALSLHAPSLAIGVLGSLPLLLGSIGQLIIPAIVDPARGRKPYIVGGVVAQVIFLLGCAASGYAPEHMRAGLYIALFTLAGLSGNIMAPIWSVWMRDLTTEETRGRLFAWRQRVFSVIHLALVLAVGVAVRKYTMETAPWTFYAIIFVAASFFRFCSGLCLAKQYEAPPGPVTKQPFSLRVSRPFLRYSTVTALMLGASVFSGPFFNVWFLRDLHFDFFQFSLSSAAIVLGTVLFLPAWGRLIDKYGAFNQMRLSAVLVAFNPLLCLFFEHPLIICVINFFSGVAWSGFNLSNFNYLLSSAREDKPDHDIAVASAMSGIVVFVFSLLGGYLATRLPVFLGWQLRSLFALSMIMRIGVSVFLILPLKPIGTAVRRIPSLELVASLPGCRIGIGILRNITRAFRRI